MKNIYFLSLAILINISFFLIGCNVEYVNVNQKDLTSKLVKTFSTSENKKLVVDLAIGNVLVTAWDKNEVSINIFGTDNIFDKLDIEVEQKGDQTVVVSAKKKGSSFNVFSGVGLRVEVKIPAKYNVSSVTRGGDVKFGGLTGNLDFSTSGGDVSTKQCSGNIKVSTSGGDITSDSTSGNLVFKTSGGDIKIVKTINSNLITNTSGGDINLLIENSQINAETSGGDISLDYRGENKEILLNTSGGDISLSLPENFDATVDISTSGGSVESNLKINNASKVSGKQIIGDFNNGGKQLKVHTSGGDVHVNKHYR